MQLLLRYEVGVCADCGGPIYFGDACELDARGNPVCAACIEEYYSRCDKCGAWVPTHELNETGDGDSVCGRCLERDYWKCDECGGYFRRTTTTHDGNEVCRSCRDALYRQCHDCGEWFRSEETERLGGEHFCEDCVSHWTVCDECGELIDTDLDETYSTHYGDTICDSCRCDRYFRCGDCGDVFPQGEENYVERDNCSYCNSCISSHDTPEGVMSYHKFPRRAYVPRYAIGEKRTGQPLYGVELECEEGSFDYCDFLRWTRKDDLVHFERDGSLDEHTGVEMITMPCSLKYHQDEMKWDELCEILVTQGFVSHRSENCGMHVHVSRSALTPVQIVKLDVFVNRANDFFRRVARRDSFYRTEYDDLKRVSRQKGTDIESTCKRYTAVNTSNDDTVEIRIFRGTLKWQTVVGTIEMVDALLRFLNTVSVARIYDTEANVRKFIDFCGERADEYPQLVPMFARLVKDGPYAANVNWWRGKIEKSSEGKESRKCA